MDGTPRAAQALRRALRNASQGSDVSPLHAAAAADAVDALATLVRAWRRECATDPGRDNAGAFARDGGKRTPLHVACALGAYDAAATLVALHAGDEAARKALLAAEDARGQRPLHRAARANDVDPEAVQTWQLWFGFFAGLSPVDNAASEFWKRARIQRGCARCAGSGLVVVGVGDEKRKVKCASCGGFLPFESWSRFFSSDPGNGGRLRAPRGQTRVFYDVDASVEASRRAVDDDEW